MKILLFGGSGQLGQEIQRRINPDVQLICPTRVECDITKLQQVFATINRERPDIVIHAAAFTDNRKVEKDSQEAVAVNIRGTCNIVNCLEPDTRLVYISTDYVYPGDRGNYLETDFLLPFNMYAWTKLAGEAAVRAMRNHLIIRTSFGCSPFPYKQAFVDKWTSKDYIDKIVPMILEATMSPLTGVLNLGTERKTLYEYATGVSVGAAFNRDVQPVRIADTSFNTPYDTSLNMQKWIDHLDRPVVTPHTKCRCCGSTKLIKYLDLGLMPLSNNLAPDAKAARLAPRYPLQVMLCNHCGLSQLSVVADPNVMFSYYTYRSGINEGYRRHCHRMLTDIFERWHFDTLVHVDVAGNDGTLLKIGRAIRRSGPDEERYIPVNVDPAVNLTTIAEADGIESVPMFWGQGAVDLVRAKHGAVQLITATNVFAHVDDIRVFLRSCANALDTLGIVVLEFPYIIDFVDRKEFDTVYFEHVSYMSLAPINQLCNELDLEIIEVSRQEIHGGSLRVTISHKNTYGVSESVLQLLDEEVNGLNLGGNKYNGWNKYVQEFVNQFNNKLLDYKRAGKKIAAFAASAKGNTLLNVAGITTDLIDFIVDETPEKIGKFSPGTGIPIVSKQWITREQPDVIVILSWNFAEEIKAKIDSMGFKGEYIIPHVI